MNILRIGLGALAALAAALSLHAQAAPMGTDEARHLLSRSGFSPTEAEVRQYAPLSRQDAVDRLLRGTRSAAITLPPEWINEPIERPARMRQLSDEERKAYQQRLARRGFDLRAWWMSEMLATPTPLTERMTLFWHNHFVSSLQKVRQPQLMYRQNVLLRRNALGNFGEMLHAVAKDPAMIIYLDSASNRKAAPNENFAREVMELFTLGEGHYTEQDIKEAARAYTGWSLEPETGEFKWRPNIHDEGVKTVLGKSGNFDGDAVLDILLAQPAAAEFIVKKLWMEFVSTDTALPANQAEIKRIAAQFRNSRYEIKAALAGIFTSPRFYAPENNANLVKSPVELVAGTVRQLGIRYSDPIPFVFVTAGLGQNLMAPPNVRGWPGGETWINSTTLLARKQFVERMFRVDEMREMAGGLPSMPAMNPANNEGGMDNMRRNDFGQVKGGARIGQEGRERFVRAAASIQFDSQKYLSQFAGAPYGAIKHAILPGEPANPLGADMTQQQLLKSLLLDPMYQLK
jgi:uncharacterized protein (DUF1800 family)